MWSGADSVFQTVGQISPGSREAAESSNARPLMTWRLGYIEAHSRPTLTPRAAAFTNAGSLPGGWPVPTAHHSPILSPLSLLIFPTLCHFPSSICLPLGGIFEGLSGSPQVLPLLLQELQLMKSISWSESQKSRGRKSLRGSTQGQDENGHTFFSDRQE